MTRHQGDLHEHEIHVWKHFLGVQVYCGWQQKGIQDVGVFRYIPELLQRGHTAHLWICFNSCSCPLTQGSDLFRPYSCPAKWNLSQLVHSQRSLILEEKLSFKSSFWYRRCYNPLYAFRGEKRIKKTSIMLNRKSCFLIQMEFLNLL